MRKGVQNRTKARRAQKESPRSRIAEKKPTKNRIIYVGNFLPAYSTENDLKKTFEHLGWEVTPIQESQLTDETVNWIIAAQDSYDFILYTRAWCEVGKQWQKVLNAKRIPVVSFHLDLYLGLYRGADLKNDNFFQSDYVFSPDGGHDELFKQLGINNIHLLPGILHASCFLGTPQDRFKHDVIFVGSYRYHPEWNYRPYLINWLKQTYGDRFRLYPDGGPAIRGAELNELYNSAKVVVGDSTWAEYYWSDRIPETIGRGGFLIHPYTPGMEKEFALYKHLIPYHAGDMKGLKEIIDYYVAHDEERDKIRLAGMEHVKENHTYINKVEFILNHLKENGAI
jgi:spore maturation protein CgeB